MDISQTIIEAIKQLGPVGLSAAVMTGVAQETGAEIFRQIKEFVFRYTENNATTRENFELLSNAPNNRIIASELQSEISDIILHNPEAQDESKKIVLLINEYSKNTGRTITAKNYIETLTAQPSSTIKIS